MRIETPFEMEDMVYRAYEAASSLFEKFPEKISYHDEFGGNLHTENVLVTLNMMFDEAADMYSLHVQTLLKIAGAFHDTGYSMRYDDNEAEGAYLADSFMTSVGFSDGDITLVQRLILATNVHMYTPKMIRKDPFYDLIAMVRDADVSTIGQTIFPITSEGLRRESAAFPNSPLHAYAKDPQKWKDLQIAFLRSYEWLSPYGYLFEEQRQINLKDLIEGRIDYNGATVRF